MCSVGRGLGTSKSLWVNSLRLNTQEEEGAVASFCTRRQRNTEREGSQLPCLQFRAVHTKLHHRLDLDHKAQLFLRLHLIKTVFFFPFISGLLQLDCNVLSGGFLYVFFLIEIH